MVRNWFVTFMVGMTKREYVGMVRRGESMRSVWTPYVEVSKRIVSVLMYMCLVPWVCELVVTCYWVLGYDFGGLWWGLFYTGVFMLVAYMGFIYLDSRLRDSVIAKTRLELKRR